MSIRLALAAVSAIALASPALAQDAAQTPPPAAAERPISAEEQAFQAEGEAFSQMMNGLVAEIQVLLNDTTTSGAQKQATADGLIEARTPQINAFADRFEAFLVSQRSQNTDPAVVAQIDQVIAQGPPNVRSIPTVLRTRVSEAIAEGAAAAAAAAAGQGAAPPPATGAVAGTPPPGAVAGTPPPQ